MFVFIYTKEVQIVIIYMWEEVSEDMVNFQYHNLPISHTVPIKSLDQRLTYLTKSHINIQEIVVVDVVRIWLRIYIYLCNRLGVIWNTINSSIEESFTRK